MRFIQIWTTQTHESENMPYITNVHSDMRESYLQCVRMSDFLREGIDSLIPAVHLQPRHQPHHLLIPTRMVPAEQTEPQRSQPHNPATPGLQLRAIALQSQTKVLFTNGDGWSTPW